MTSSHAVESCRVLSVIVKGLLLDLSCRYAYRASLVHTCGCVPRPCRCPRCGKGTGVAPSPDAPDSRCGEAVAAGVHTCGCVPRPRQYSLWRGSLAWHPDATDPCCGKDG
jgi:hypothetical protein